MARDTEGKAGAGGQASDPASRAPASEAIPAGDPCPDGEVAEQLQGSRLRRFERGVSLLDEIAAELEAEEASAAASTPLQAQLQRLLQARDEAGGSSQEISPEVSPSAGTDLSTRLLALDDDRRKGAVFAPDFSSLFASGFGLLGAEGEADNARGGELEAERIQNLLRTRAVPSPITAVQPGSLLVSAHTWNVGNAPPPPAPSVANWLRASAQAQSASDSGGAGGGVAADGGGARSAGGNGAGGWRVRPHIVAVALQEMDTSVGNIMFAGIDSKRAAQWEKVVADALGILHSEEGVDCVHGEEGEDVVGAGAFVTVLSKQMGSVFLTVHARAGVASEMSEVSASGVSVGMLGVIGNKGAAAVRVRVRGDTVCFVAVHVHAGDQVRDFHRRVADVGDICSKLEFLECLRLVPALEHARGHRHVEVMKFRPPLSLDHHDKVIWMGDLNFRLRCAGAEARACALDPKRWRLLSGFDELYSAMASFRVLPHFQEGRLDFAPTYKYDVGTDVYDSSVKQRAPAWTDRILWRGSRVRLLSYTSYPALRTSDHRPVSVLLSYHSSTAASTAHSRFEAAASATAAAAVPGGRETDREEGAGGEAYQLEPQRKSVLLADLENSLMLLGDTLSEVGRASLGTWDAMAFSDLSDGGDAAGVVQERGPEGATGAQQQEDRLNREEGGQGNENREDRAEASPEPAGQEGEKQQEGGATACKTTRHGVGSASCPAHSPSGTPRGVAGCEGMTASERRHLDAVEAEMRREGWGEGRGGLTREHVRHIASVGVDEVLDVELFKWDKALTVAGLSAALGVRIHACAAVRGLRGSVRLPAACDDVAQLVWDLEKRGGWDLGCISCHCQTRFDDHHLLLRMTRSCAEGAEGDSAGTRARVRDGTGQGSSDGVADAGCGGKDGTHVTFERVLMCRRLLPATSSGDVAVDLKAKRGSIASVDVHADESGRDRGDGSGEGLGDVVILLQSVCAGSAAVPVASDRPRQHPVPHQVGAGGVRAEIQPEIKYEAWFLSQSGAHTDVTVYVDIALGGSRGMGHGQSLALLQSLGNMQALLT